MTLSVPEHAATSTHLTRDLIIRLAWLYVAGGFTLLTLLYEAYIGGVMMITYVPSPLWQDALLVSAGALSAVPAWFAGRAYLRACRRGTIAPAAFALRWLGAPLVLVALIGLAVFLRARSLR